jgi:hypothetical protein
MAASRHSFDTALPQFAHEAARQAKRAPVKAGALLARNRPPIYMPALISVCSVAALASSFCSSAAAIEAVKALVSFICWMA